MKGGTNEIEDSIRVLMEPVYEARISYSQSLDPGTISIDLIKILVSFQPLLPFQSRVAFPRRVLFFEKLLNISATCRANCPPCQKFEIASNSISRNSVELPLRATKYRR